ncbi:hypothetical protein L228DRAFT_281314 [Xylona heveae TC161]|uniref:Mitochondrial outer membrane transport complex Sam37/metaxin N-terminal domain-containing protein n=1 Tax=Xylona heveae (strain CBS 132557 / TC161) TaxID=1328760 RepID=A0A165I1B5_XYLHT|nr:hypothetical protein L228DRAFT_281314 [Xylona heveae TC161]KZF24215.1 hypothetical protein L228DRAFT_281314 [Xylona heveae TC161]
MTLELHIWGPAFSLPSIDAQCLAAIAYLTQAVPKDHWVLVASSDPSLSPTRELPVLKDGPTCISGFRNIIDYLRQCNGEWYLDRKLDAQQKADCTAFTSFIESNGQPLVDLSLYVSTENYTGVTRSAYSSILPWPTQYITPPRRRAAAKARTAHLGLSSLDLDTAADETNNPSQASGTAAGTPGQTEQQIPTSLLRKPKETVTRLLRQPHYANRFRLDALTTAFFEPLQTLLGKKKFLLTNESEGPTSLDCVALAYLSLALYAELPHAWLADALRNKFGRLAAYTHNLRRLFFGARTVSPSDALASPVPSSNSQAAPPSASRTTSPSYSSSSPTDPTSPSSTTALPFVAPSQGGLLSIGSLLLSNIADSLPIVGQFRATNRLRAAAAAEEAADPSEVEFFNNMMRRARWEVVTQALTVAAGVSAFVVYMLYHGIVILPGSSPSPSSSSSSWLGHGDEHDEEYYEGPEDEDADEDQTAYATLQGQSRLDNMGDAGAALAALMNYDIPDDLLHGGGGAGAGGHPEDSASHSSSTGVERDDDGDHGPHPSRQVDGSVAATDHPAPGVDVDVHVQPDRP